MDIRREIVLPEQQVLGLSFEQRPGLEVGARQRFGGVLAGIAAETLRQELFHIAVGQETVRTAGQVPEKGPKAAHLRLDAPAAVRRDIGR